jgi:hypothetical protein
MYIYLNKREISVFIISFDNKNRHIAMPSYVNICTTMGWRIGVPGFDSRQGLGIFLFTTASRTALGPTQPHIQWVPGALSMGVKRPVRESDHSPPSSAEVKE